MDLPLLHRRLLTVLGLASLVAYASGAGLETPGVPLAAVALVTALFWEPSPRLYQRLDWFWRFAALALMLRAVYFTISASSDVVVPLVDVLLVLLVSEALRPAEATHSTRMYLVSFALLIGAVAYRAGAMFGISFIVYISTGTVALMIGHLLREAHRAGSRPPPLRRAFILRVAALSSVMLLMSGLLFLVFPRATRDWVSLGTPVTSNVVGFSDRISLAEHGGRIYPNPQVVLRVEFPDGQIPGTRNLYWRGRSYDFFDGTGWWNSPRVQGANVSPLVYRQQWPRERLRQKIYAVPLDVPVLFALHPALSVRPLSRMTWASDATGDLFYDAAGPPIYEAVSVTRKPSDDELRARPETSARVDPAYLQLPELSRGIRALADSLVRGANTRLDRVRAVEHWLRTEFRYTLDLPAQSEATLDRFLFSRRAGHCEYFSTAMVVLLRAAGIPARNVNGFLGGEWNEFGNYLSITQNQAHSWVEVWFPGAGWVTFDPTPAAATDIAAAAQPWLGSLRFLLDGFEHRWTKWVLDYNMDLQLDLFRRTAASIAHPFVKGRDEAAAPLRIVLLFAAVALALFLLLRRLATRGRPAPARFTSEARLYMRLRRLYRSSGLTGEHDLPLTFLAKLQRAGAPGADAADLVVSLYLESRFGGVDIGEAGRARMRAALDQATRAVRRASHAA